MNKCSGNGSMTDHVYLSLRNSSSPGSKVPFLMPASLRLQQNGYAKSPNFQVHHLLEKKSQIWIHATPATETAAGKYGRQGKKYPPGAFYFNISIHCDQLGFLELFFWNPNHFLLGFSRLFMWQILQRFKRKPRSSMKNGRSSVSNLCSWWSPWVGILFSKRYFQASNLSLPRFLEQVVYLFVFCICDLIEKK